MSIDVSGCVVSMWSWYATMCAGSGVELLSEYAVTLRETCSLGYRTETEDFILMRARGQYRFFFGQRD